VNPVDKKTLYDSFTTLEGDLQKTVQQIQRLQKEMAEIVERNAELEIENRHLREHLQEIQKAPDDKSTGAVELSKSKLNLENLYEEGFHVCAMFYGQRRIDDEACAFCLDIIYGER